MRRLIARLRTLLNSIESSFGDTLFKYYSLTDDQDSNARKIQTLQDQQVFNGLCKDMNDPYDGKAYFYRHEAIQKFIRNPEALNTPITVR